MRCSFCAQLALAVIVWTGSGCARTRARSQAAWPRYTLVADQTWRLNLPENKPFGASGLLLRPSHELLVVNDRQPQLYRVEFRAHSESADLVPLTNCYTPAQLAPLAAEKSRPFDCEGVAADESARIYVCEEGDRWVLRFDPRTQKVERLKIDWSPVQRYFSRADPNASFEGIAVGKGRLYVANERNEGRIIVVDLESLRVIDDFVVHSSVWSLWAPHYSDLCWHGNALYVLMREEHVVLQVDPRSHRVLAEYDFRGIEFGVENQYHLLFPFIGVMEGLAVDESGIWLVTDNNGLGRAKHPDDTRPTLFRCRRPDAR